MKNVTRRGPVNVILSCCLDFVMLIMFFSVGAKMTTKNFKFAKTAQLKLFNFWHVHKELGNVVSSFFSQSRA